MVGNGYLGYRGTRPDQGADDFVGCIVSDTYDMADGVWRELCTVPNGLHVALAVGDQRLTFAPDARRGGRTHPPDRRVHPSLDVEHRRRPTRPCRSDGSRAWTTCTS